MANDSPGGAPELLIIAASARFLAAAAAAAGRAFSAIDCFTDVEVRSLARRAVRVPFAAAAANGPDCAAARAACARLLGQRRFEGVVVGPGLDACPELIAWLSARLPVYANAAEVFALCRDRRRFTERLRRLDIPHPPEGAAAPAPALAKLAGASGGAHVRFTPARAAACRRSYRQSYQPGTAVSHLFIAGTAVASVGWNTQWQSHHGEGPAFCYGGAINRSPLTAAQRAQTEDYAARLAREFSLVGVNSADYVVCGDELFLLELNPRVSATMQLHDDPAGVLFTAHLDACRSPSLAPSRPEPQAPRAHAVMYASRPLTISRGFAWPAGARDLPANVDRPRAWAPGEPVCTLTAHARTAAETLRRVQHSIRSLNAQFTRRRAAPGERSVMRPIAPAINDGAGA